MSRMPLRRRMDHGPMFVCVTLGLLAGALYILSHWNTKTPLFSWLSLGTENTMGVVQLIGSLGAMFGILSGTKYLLPGMDLRDSYNIVKWSCLPMGIGFGTFVVGAILTGFIPWFSEAMWLFMAIEAGLFFVATELNIEQLRLTRELNRRIEAMTT